MSAERALLDQTTHDVTSGAPANQPQLRCYLLVFECGAASVHFLHPEAPAVIGRGEQAQLRLGDGSVSRAHASIAVSGGAARIEDLGSHNGTRVNGERIEGPRELQAGDVVSI